MTRLVRSKHTLAGGTKGDPVPYPKLVPYFEGHALRFRRGISGNRLDEDGTLFIGDGHLSGDWERPDYLGESNTIHEMAHFVEIDQRRCGMYGWGLKVPEKFIYNRLVPVPMTHKIADREMRVLAYQFNILEALGLLSPELMKLHIEAVVNFTPDWANIPASSDQGRIRWARNQIKKYRKTLTFEKFEVEWWRRSEVLKARAKRKPRAA